MARVAPGRQPTTSYEALPRDQLLPLRLTPFPPQPRLERTAETDADGRFEFFVGPGNYTLEGPPGVMRSPSPAFALTDQKEFDVDAWRPPSRRMTLRFVRADGPNVGLPGARYQAHRFDGEIPVPQRADASGTATIETAGEVVIEALDADEKLLALVESKPGPAELLVPLGPPAAVLGRVVDRAGRRFTGRVDYHAVSADRTIRSGYEPSVASGRAQLTDDGRFVLDELAPGWTYSLSAMLDYPDAPRRGRSQHAWLGTAHTKSDGPVDLGDIVIEP